jgi:hypothetical protein
MSAPPASAKSDPGNDSATSDAIRFSDPDGFAKTFNELLSSSQSVLNIKSTLRKNANPFEGSRD